MEHSITLKDRSNLHISGIEHIYSFNDKKVELRTKSPILTSDEDFATFPFIVTIPLSQASFLYYKHFRRYNRRE